MNLFRVDIFLCFHYSPVLKKQRLVSSEFNQIVCGIALHSNKVSRGEIYCLEHRIGIGAMFFVL